MKPLLAFLLLLLSQCCPAFAADPSNGPLFGIWHIDGHGYQWQVDQQAAGLPMQSCIRLPSWTALGTVGSGGSVTDLNTQAALIGKLDRGCVVLRMNNITEEFNGFNGVAGTASLTPFGGNDAWTATGTAVGSSAWMQRLYALIPNPGEVILLENNEGPPFIPLSKFYSKGVCQWANSGVWARLQPGMTLADLQASWFIDSVTHQPVPAGCTFSIDATGLINWFVWKSDADCAAIDPLAPAWLATRRSNPLTQTASEYDALRIAKYQALYAALKTAMPPAWRDDFRTCGYHDHASNLQNDAGSAGFYLGTNLPNSTTDPAYLRLFNRAAWDADDLKWSRAWREFSVSATIRQTPLYAGAQAGQCDVIDPESYGAWMAVGAWMMQKPGKEVRMTYFDGYLSPPSKPAIYTDGAKAICDQIGRPDLKAATLGDYETAVLRRFAEVHAHPLLRDYWQHGETSILTTAQPVTATWATETVIAGNPRTLLCVYQMAAPAQLQVGQYTVPASRFAYYLTNPLEPLPPPVLTVEELTNAVRNLEQRVRALEN